MLLDKGKTQTNYAKRMCSQTKDRHGIEPEEAGISCLQTHSITPRPMQVKAIGVVIIAIFCYFHLRFWPLKIPYSTQPVKINFKEHSTVIIDHVCIHSYKEVFMQSDYLLVLNRLCRLVLSSDATQQQIFFFSVQKTCIYYGNSKKKSDIMSRGKKIRSPMHGPCLLLVVFYLLYLNVIDCDLFIYF